MRVNKSCAIYIVIVVICMLSNFVKAEDRVQALPEPIVSISFFDTDVREALKELAIQSGVNIIVGEGIYGVVTLDAQRVPLSTALKMLLISGGYTYKKIDDFYFVGMVDPKGRNFRVLSDTVIYKTKYVDTEVVRSSLPSIHDQFVKFSKEQSTVTITAPQNIIDAIMVDLKKIDVPKHQIRIKSLVTQISSADAKDLGINLLEWTKGSSDKANVLGASYSGGELKISFDGFDRLLSTVQLLATNKKATIHADPVVVVTEGKPAELFTGKRITISQVNGASTSNEQVEVGTSLSVTPRVIGDKIELSIVQKVSDVDTSESKYVASSARELTSTVVVSPGQTVLVGSISQKQTIDSKSKIPVLGDIPLVNLLFNKVNKQISDSELMIFVTAEVV